MFSDYISIVKYSEVLKNKPLSELPYLGQANVTPDDNHKYTYTADNKEDYIYVMLMKDGEIVSEPFIPSEVTV